MNKLLYLLLTAVLATTSSVDAMKQPDGNIEQPSPKKTKTSPDIRLQAERGPGGSISSLQEMFIPYVIDNICNGNLTAFHQISFDLQEKVILEFANPATYDSFAQHLVTISSDNLDLILQDDVFCQILQSCCCNITLDQCAAYLRTACDHNHLAVVKTIFATVGPDTANQLCTIQDIYGNTALHFAASQGHTEIVELILALPNAEELCTIQDNDGDTALHMAAYSGYTKIVKLILALPNAQELCSIKTDDGYTELRGAAIEGHTDIVKLILALPNAQELCSIQDNDGNTALYWAAFNDRTEIVKLILALPNAQELCSIQDNDGDTALHWVAFNGQTEIIELILALPNAQELCTIQDNYGRTALHRAVYSGNNKIIQLLKEKIQ